MKKLFVVMMVLFFAVTAMAETQEQWDAQYKQMLMKGKVTLAKTKALLEKNGKSLGLGYTQTELGILEGAISFGVEKNCAPCTMMKGAIDLQYKPYDTIKLIYSKGKDVKLDQLCMCAIEQGINKTLIVKSMVDAVDEYGKPKFHRDEIIQSQCMESEGLGYTAQMTQIPRIIPPPKPKPISPATPSGPEKPPIDTDGEY